jgi:hypothetical protein
MRLDLALAGELPVGSVARPPAAPGVPPDHVTAAIRADSASFAALRVSMAEVALAWVTGRPGVSSTILGARTMSQLQTDLRAADLHLTAAETATLDAASDPHPTDYPYGELGVEQRTRTLPAGH